MTGGEVFTGRALAAEAPTSSRTTARARREARALEAGCRQPPEPGGCRPCATALWVPSSLPEFHSHGESQTPFNNFCWLWLMSAGRFTVSEGQDAARRQLGRAHQHRFPQESRIKASIEMTSFWHFKGGKGAVNVSPGLISPGANSCGATNRSTARAEALGSPQLKSLGQECHHGSPLAPHLLQGSTPVAGSPCRWFNCRH